MKFILLFFWASVSSAFVPKASLILQKNAESTGSGSYVIEQEIQFASSPEPFILRETWVIENENQMKLTVSGTKDWKDLIHWQVLYSGGQKTLQFGSQRKVSPITLDFIERYFHFRNPEHFASALIQMKIVPANIMAKKTLTNLKDLNDQPEAFVRLSRVGGVVNYAFGTPATPESVDSSPGFWFEQDQFVLRKFRLSSGAEVQADSYSPYLRGLNFPRKRNVRWDNQQVNIQTLAVSGRNAKITNSLDASRVDGLDNVPIKAAILEFYNRFR